MPLSTIQNTEKALKEKFLPFTRRQLDEKSGPFLAMIEKNADNIRNYKISIPFQYGRHGSIGNRAEDGTLPDPSAPKWERGSTDLKNIFATIRLTDKLIKSSKGDSVAFANQLSNQMKTLLIDASDSLRRQSLGDGTGKVATCAVNTATVTLEVDSVRALYEGQVIDVMTFDGGSKKADGVEILVRDKTNNTIKISGSTITTIATDIIVMHDSYNQELTGLKKIFTENSTIYGLDRSVATWFNPQIKDLATAELDELDMQEMIDEVEQEMGSQINFIMGTYGTRRAFINNQKTYKRNTEMMQIKGGYNVISYNGIPLTAEKYLEPNILRFLATDTFKLARIEQWDWMQKDGSILHRDANTPSYSAVLVYYGNLINTSIASQAELRGIIEH